MIIWFFLITLISLMIDSNWQISLEDRLAEVRLVSESSAYVPPYRDPETDRGALRGPPAADSGCFLHSHSWGAISKNYPKTITSCIFLVKTNIWGNHHFCILILGRAEFSTIDHLFFVQCRASCQPQNGTSKSFIPGFHGMANYQLMKPQGPGTSCSSTSHLGTRGSCYWSLLRFRVISSRLSGYGGQWYPGVFYVQSDFIQ